MNHISHPLDGVSADRALEKLNNVNNHSHLAIVIDKSNKGWVNNYTDVFKSIEVDIEEFRELDEVYMTKTGLIITPLNLISEGSYNYKERLHLFFAVMQNVTRFCGLLLRNEIVSNDVINYIKDHELFRIIGNKIEIFENYNLKLLNSVNFYLYLPDVHMIQVLKFSEDDSWDFEGLYEPHDYLQSKDYYFLPETFNSKNVKRLLREPIKLPSLRSLLIDYSEPFVIADYFDLTKVEQFSTSHPYGDIKLNDQNFKNLTHLSLEKYASIENCIFPKLKYISFDREIPKGNSIRIVSVNAPELEYISILNPEENATIIKEFHTSEKLTRACIAITGSDIDYSFLKYIKDFESIASESWHQAIEREDISRSEVESLEIAFGHLPTKVQEEFDSDDEDGSDFSDDRFIRSEIEHNYNLGEFPELISARFVVAEGINQVPVIEGPNLEYFELTAIQGCGPLNIETIPKTIRELSLTNYQNMYQVFDINLERFSKLERLTLIDRGSMNGLKLPPTLKSLVLEVESCIKTLPFLENSDSLISLTINALEKGSYLTIDQDFPSLNRLLVENFNNVKIEKSIDNLKHLGLIKIKSFEASNLPNLRTLRDILSFQKGEDAPVRKFLETHPEFKTEEIKESSIRYTVMKNFFKEIE